jgi:hypothetical protein
VTNAARHRASAGLVLFFSPCDWSSLRRGFSNVAFSGARHKEWQRPKLNKVNLINVSARMCLVSELSHSWLGRTVRSSPAKVTLSNVLSVLSPSCRRSRWVHCSIERLRLQISSIPHWALLAQTTRLEEQQKTREEQWRSIAAGRKGRGRGERSKAEKRACGMTLVGLMRRPLLSLCSTLLCSPRHFLLPTVLPHLFTYGPYELLHSCSSQFAPAFEAASAPDAVQGKTAERNSSCCASSCETERSSSHAG